MFYSLSKLKFGILATLDLSSENAFSLVKAKILLSGKELNPPSRTLSSLFFQQLFSCVLRNAAQSLSLKQLIPNFNDPDENGKTYFVIFHDIFLTLYHTILTLGAPRKRPFKNIVRKGENAGFYFSQNIFQFFSPINFIVFICFQF